MPKIIVGSFNNRPILTFLLDGKPAWLAAQIGNVLGFVDPEYGAGGWPFVRRLIVDWTPIDTVVEGRDYHVLSDDEMRALLGDKTPADAREGGFVLREFAMRLACLKAGSADAQRLIEMLADHAAPELMEAHRRASAHVRPEVLELPLPRMPIGKVAPAPRRASGASSRVEAPRRSGTPNGGGAAGVAALATARRSASWGSCRRWPWGWCSTCASTRASTACRRWPPTRCGATR